MTLNDKRTAQQKHFDEIYEVFYAFYQEKLATDLPPYERVRLMLTTRFFDDLELQRRLAKTSFSAFPSTPADKQAVAQTAYFDAITIHNRLAGMTFHSVADKDVCTGKVKP